MLPAVVSWWCGDDRQRAYVLDHLDELAIKGAFPQAQSRARGPRPAARRW